MRKYELVVLGCGTSTGVPVPACTCEVCQSGHPKNYRTRTSVYLTSPDGPDILIDTSTDLRHQALTQRVMNVDAVLFTHGHSDHVAGFDDLRVYNFVHKREIPCWADANTLNYIRKVYDYIITPDPNYLGGAVGKVSLNQISHYESFDVMGVEVLPFLLKHGSMDVSGFRIGGLSYATDCKEIPQKSMDIMKGSDILIIDGLRYRPHSTHLIIPEALEIIEKLNPKKAYLIHMTHDIDYEPESKKLPAGVEFCFDGLRLEFSC